MLLADISWPVYLLGRGKPNRLEDGSLVYNREDTVSIIDNPNIPGKTLGARRLALLSRGEKLAHLRVCLFFPGDLIKEAKSTKWFIDSSGKLFQYKKTRRAKLKSYRISKVLPITLGALIEVEGLPSRFKTLSKPKDTQRYVGMLEVSFASYIIYGFYEEPFKETWRMI